jgi:hypothetical protein
MTLISEITLDSVTINGCQFVRGEILQVYERVLGQPTRSIMPGPAPPYGHRNNVIHFYDHLGLLLREHHASYLIAGIGIVLEPKRCCFPTTSPYSGSLRVCGAEVRAGMDVSEFARQSSIIFRLHLGHAWYADGDLISIHFEVYPERGKAPLIADMISEVAIGYVGAHREPS